MNPTIPKMPDNRVLFTKREAAMDKRPKIKNKGHNLVPK